MKKVKIDYTDRDYARKYFKDNNLTYDYIHLNDLYVLQSMLDIEFAKQKTYNRINGRTIYWESVNDAKYFKGKYTSSERLIKAYITGKGGYFTAREVISFYDNGHIGFCGEASGCNIEPVIKAFIDWCNYLISKNYTPENDI